MIWATNQAGRAQPFDAEPSPKGTSTLTTGSDGVIRARLVPAEQRRGLFSEPLYMPHHATCPDAERFRRTPARPESRT
jgi:hypothetical protein